MAPPQFLAEAADDEQGIVDAEAKRLRLARNPTGRFGQPEDIVNAGIYLASDESAWTNGAVLVVDGGITSNYF